MLKRLLIGGLCAIAMASPASAEKLVLTEEDMVQTDFAGSENMAERLFCVKGGDSIDRYIIYGEQKETTAPMILPCRLPHLDKYAIYNAVFDEQSHGITEFIATAAMEPTSRCTKMRAEFDQLAKKFASELGENYIDLRELKDGSEYTRAHQYALSLSKRDRRHVRYWGPESGFEPVDGIKSVLLRITVDSYTDTKKEGEVGYRVRFVTDN